MVKRAAPSWHRARSSGDRHDGRSNRVDGITPPPAALPPEEPTPPSASWPEDETARASRISGRKVVARRTRLRARSGGRAGRHGAVVARVVRRATRVARPGRVRCVRRPMHRLRRLRLLRATRSSSRRSCTCPRTPTSRARSRPSSTSLRGGGRFGASSAPRDSRAGSSSSLRMPGLEIDEPVAALVWRRRTESVQFGVRVPPGAPAGMVIGTLAVSVDSAPSGYVKFQLAIETGVTPRIVRAPGRAGAPLRLPSSPMHRRTETRRSSGATSEGVGIRTSRTCSISTRRSLAEEDRARHR